MALQLPSRPANTAAKIPGDYTMRLTESGWEVLRYVEVRGRARYVTTGRVYATAGEAREVLAQLTRRAQRNERPL